MADDTSNKIPTILLLGRSSVRSTAHRSEDQQQPVQPVSPADIVQQYQQAFERVQSVTGAASVEELLHHLVAAEEANFSLFNYVNELNGEIEKLEEQISGVRYLLYCFAQAC